MNDVAPSADLTGCRRGLVAIPRSDAGTVMRLADQGYMVYAVCASQAQYEEPAAGAAKTGLLGRRVYLELNPDPVPGLAERLADVVLVPKLTKADMTAERKAEWLRVPAPHRR